MAPDSTGSSSNPAGQSGANDSALVPEATEPQTFAGQLKSIAGLLALIAGLVAIIVILLVAELAGVSAQEFTTLATAAIGVVGSGVGAYFGVKVGTDGTAKAVQGQREEAAHAQIFAAHLPSSLAQTALHNAFPQAIAAPTASPAPTPSPDPLQP